MSARTDTIREAVVELRKRLKVDQTTFARMLGKSYPMARRYETDVPPQGEALAPFALLADESQYPDLADVFRTALVEDLPDVTKALAETSGHISAKGYPTIPRDMLFLVEWFVAFFQRKGTPDQEVLKHSLKALAAEHTAAVKREKKKNVS